MEDIDNWRAWMVGNACTPWFLPCFCLLLFYLTKLNNYYAK